MSDSFTKVSTLFHTTWPKIAAIDWSAFGDKLAPYNEEAGIPKWTGAILHFAPRGPVVGSNTQVEGFLPRPTESAQIVVMKTRILHANKGSMSSIELRDPERKYWGGGFRSSHDPDEIYAISGLPEIGDHLYMGQLLRECEVLSLNNWHDANDVQASWMVAARQYVGMSNRQYTVLEKLIHDIVQGSRA
jgi:hypothetical protein